MIRITRDGHTTIYTGWKAWLMGAAALIGVWLLLAFLAFVGIGVAVTIGLILVLALPAALIVAAIGSVLRR